MHPLIHFHFHLLLTLLPAAALADGPGLALARPFDSHMVLPMERSIPVRGSAAPRGKVELRFGSGTLATTTAAADGSWRIDLPPLPASDRPATLTITAAEEKIVLKDILVGRVWLCSGQSNMDFQLSRAPGGPQEAAAAGKQKTIRLFNRTAVPTDDRAYGQAELSRLNPRDHFQGTWQPATPASASAFSAIGWWTGRILQDQEQDQRKIPIGLIDNSVGGSGTEAWLPLETLRSRPAYRSLLGDDWLKSEHLTPWVRARAQRNLGTHLRASHPFKPGFLFESGTRDLAGFPLDGVFWYQGETNAEINDPAWNGRLITDLIGGWRQALGQPRLPFFLIQLPRIGGQDPLRKYWPEYRLAQARAAAEMKGVTLVVTRDLGWDSPDVHPPDKLPVARRLAGSVLSARK